MNIEEINLNNLKNMVKDRMVFDCSGHDWLHVCRVQSLAYKIITEDNLDRIKI